jgi:hypothetical protein
MHDSILDWLTVRPVTRSDRYFSYIVLPAFAILGVTWKGASEVIRQWGYSANRNFALRRKPTKPDDSNYMLCIRYREDDEVTRYRLWNDDAFGGSDEIFPLYSGQRIRANFVLEAWNLEDETTCDNPAALYLQTGIMTRVTDFSSTPADVEEDAGTEVSAALFSTLDLPLTFDSGGAWIDND